MKNRKLVFAPIIMLIFAFLFVATVSVQASAKTASWTTAVTYQNVGTGPATLNVSFYEEGSVTPLSYDPMDGGTLAAGAARSFWIGSVSNVPGGFQGNAIMSSSEPIVSTVVQFSQDPGFKMRLLYNGFQSQDVSQQYLIATTLLNKFGRTTVFSIQNTEEETIDATIKFYDADDNGKLVSTKVHEIPANSSKTIDLSLPADTGLPASTTVFNGSAIVEAKTKANVDANVVAAINEYYTNRDVAASFEGVPVTLAGNTVYMATGLCERYGLDTYYAVSNAQTTGDATITIQYNNTDGSKKATDGPYKIGPGQKRSIVTCAPSDGTNMSNFTGSAVVTSVGNPIVAIGKAQNSSNAGKPATTDVFTIFIGEPAGTSKKSLSFVRWANDAQYNDPNNNGGKQRSYIAVQNLENSSVKVDAEYYDKDGKLVATHPLTIPALAKANTDALAAGAVSGTGMVSGAFGYYTDNTSGGAVILRAHSDNPTAKFIAIARVQNPGAGEDVNAVAIP